MSFVCSTLGENRGPTAGYLESVITDFQESQNALRRIIDTSNELPKFFKFMQGRIGLPPLAGPEFRQISSLTFKRYENLCI